MVRRKLEVRGEMEERNRKGREIEEMGEVQCRKRENERGDREGGRDTHRRGD